VDAAKAFDTQADEFGEALRYPVDPLFRPALLVER